MFPTTCYSALAAGIYLAKVSRRNRRTKYQICFKLTVTEQCQEVILVSSLLTFTDSTTYDKVFTADFEPVIVGLVCMVYETQNLLTSEYTVYSEIPFNRSLYHRHSKFNPKRAGLF